MQFVVVTAEEAERQRQAALHPRLASPAPQSQAATGVYPAPVVLDAVQLPVLGAAPLPNQEWYPPAPAAWPPGYAPSVYDAAVPGQRSAFSLRYLVYMVLALIALDGISLHMPALAPFVQPLHHAVMDPITAFIDDGEHTAAVVPVPAPAEREFALANQPTIGLTVYQSRLQHIGSPLLAESDVAYAALVRAGIDPAVQVAVLEQDSSHVPLSQILPPERNIHNLSAMRCATCAPQPAAFRSYLDAVAAWIDMVQRSPGIANGATVEHLLRAQCRVPTCDPTAMTDMIESTIRDLRQSEATSIAPDPTVAPLTP